jgi:pilus assembly protein Flp/PilA
LNDLQQAEQLHSVELAPAAMAVSWKSFLRDESGQDLVEYVLVAALIALAAISAMKGLGTSISSAYSSLASNMTSNT